MEEHVIKLATLQAEMNSIAGEIAADRIIKEYTAAIAELEKQVSEGRDALYNIVSAYGQDLIEKEMETVKAQIIDEWTGENKTMVFDAGTLKFTRRGSLKINDPGFLLGGIIRATSIVEAANKYIIGFNLTAVKKYMGVHELPTDIAEIEYKTTVKLEQKG